MVQLSLESINNQKLFSNHFLEERLPERDIWTEDEDELQQAFNQIKELYENEKGRLSGYNEAQLEDNFIKKVFQILGHVYEVQETLNRGELQPDYAFYDSEEKRRQAMDEDSDSYEHTVAVGDAKRWGTKLDKKTKKAEERWDKSNPSWQIYVYLKETDAPWGVLTDGRYWRIYSGEEAKSLEVYYQVDLTTIIEEDNFEAFRYFYYFFRKEAFLPDASGTSFLDRVYEESVRYAEAVGKDLEDRIYRALEWMVKGYFNVGTNRVNGEPLEKKEEHLEIVHENSLIFLYRLLFVLYADANGLIGADKDLPDEYDINKVVSEALDDDALDAENVDEVKDTGALYNWQLNRIFELIDEGDADLDIPAYNGGLFDNDKYPFFSMNENEKRNKIQNPYLAKVIELLTKTEEIEGKEEAQIDYADLSIRHLGGIYEGLLEYNLEIAPEDLVAVKDGKSVKWVSKDEAGNKDVVDAVDEGELYLVTDDEERKVTGSYYTPDYVVEYIVENTLEPILDEKFEEIDDGLDEEERWEAERAAILDTNILDPAMGSGHFLVGATDYLANKLVPYLREEELEGIDESRHADKAIAKRLVVKHCIYGVDINPLATELAKVSLWLNTILEGKPLPFLSHHLKTGNSLIGADVDHLTKHPKEVDHSTDATDEDDKQGLESFMAFGDEESASIQKNVKELVQNFKDIEQQREETIDDIRKEKEIYNKKFLDSDFRKKFDVLADVHTSYYFGNDYTTDDYRRLVEAFQNGDSWDDITSEDWVRRATNSVQDPEEDNLSRQQQFFHWQLEFPEIFFDPRTGTEGEESGFDVVMGNPPWLDVKGLPNPDILFDFYQCSFNRVNIYGSFFERCTRLLREDALFGFITPNSFMTQSSYKRLREHILDRYAPVDIVRLPDGVFDEVTMETVISVLRRRNNPGEGTISVHVYDHNSSIENISPKTAENKEISISRWRENEDKIFDIFTSDEELEVLSMIEDTDTVISDEFETCLGLTPYDKHEGHTEEQIENRVFHSNDKESENHFKITTGEGIKRYSLTWTGGEWIKYGEWLGAPREKKFFTEPRCVVRQIVSQEPHGINAAFSEENLFHTQVGFVLLPKNGREQKAKAITGILNSKLMTFYHRKKYLDEEKDTFQKILIQDAKRFPLPENYESDDLVDMVEKMMGLKKDRDRLNLDLLSHLGISEEGNTAGKKLGDMSSPPANLPETPLAQTEEDLEGLRIEEVHFDEEDGLTMQVDISYKSSEEDSRSTDRYGRLTKENFERYKAMEFHDLTEIEETLVRAFVPVAVDKNDGFADFRDNATKNKTLIARLKKLTLPDLDNVQEGLDTYIETQERAEELDQEIAKTDTLIDQSVYDLYGLDNEEIEVVESALNSN